MANVQFIQTTRSKLPSIDTVEGKIYFCTDTTEIFVDTKIGSTVTRLQYAKLPTNLSELYNDVGYLDNNTGDARYVKKSGDTMTGVLKVSSGSANYERGIMATDKSGEEYGLIRDNGTNLWIGAVQTDGYHHVGRTFISTGYSDTESTGYPTMFVSVPNATNDGGTNYPIYHGNYRPYHYGTCSTAAATADKVASINVGGPNFALSTGTIVFIKFTYSNTATNPTLNIDTTGAKAIRRYGTTSAGDTVATSWPAGSVIGFLYDGTQFQMLNWLNTDTNTTYSNATTSQAGLMSAADKVISDSVVRTTPSVYNPRPTYDDANSGLIWSNATNKIGIGVTQIEDKTNYRFYVREDSLRFVKYTTSGSNYTPGTSTEVWKIFPTSGNTPISVSNGVVSHVNSGVTAGTYGTDSSTALTPAFGGTFSVPGFKANATGHVTSASSHTVKMPNAVATQSAAGLMSADDKKKLDRATWAWSTDTTQWTMNGTYLGYITASSKELRFFIPWPHQIVGNIRWDWDRDTFGYFQLTGSARGVNGYVNGSQYLPTGMMIGEEHIEMTSSASGRGITVTMKYYSASSTTNIAWPNATNNTPVAVTISGKMGIRWVE